MQRKPLCATPMEIFAGRSQAPCGVFSALPRNSIFYIISFVWRSTNKVKQNSLQWKLVDWNLNHLNWWIIRTTIRSGQVFIEIHVLKSLLIWTREASAPDNSNYMPPHWQLGAWHTARKMALLHTHEYASPPGKREQRTEKLNRVKAI